MFKNMFPALIIASGALLAGCYGTQQGGGGGGAAETETEASSSSTATPLATTATPATPSATAASSETEEIALRSDDDHLEDEGLEFGRKNEVKVENRKDGRLRIRTNLQLNRIEGDTVTPLNSAEARSECTDCQSIAVAVQVNVYERGASKIAPINSAVAWNESCERCVTIARAIQYVIPVDDVDALPKEVDALVRAINKEAHYFEKLNDATEVDEQEVERRLQSVMDQFAELDQYLTQATDTDTADDSPAPTTTPEASPSPGSTSGPMTVTPTPGSAVSGPTAPPSATSTPAASSSGSTATPIATAAPTDRAATPTPEDTD